MAENPEIRERTDVIRVEKKEYGGWKNGFYVSDARMDLVVLSDVGPRVVRYCLPSRTKSQFRGNSASGPENGPATTRGRPTLQKSHGDSDPWQGNLVDVTGFEPATSCLQSTRSPS
jgi:hypothetical protein